METHTSVTESPSAVSCWAADGFCAGHLLQWPGGRPRLTLLNQGLVQSFSQPQKSVCRYSVLHWRKRHFQKSAICSALALDCVGRSSSLMKLLALGFPGNEVQGKDKATCLKIGIQLTQKLKEQESQRRSKEASYIVDIAWVVYYFAQHTHS